MGRNRARCLWRGGAWNVVQARFYLGLVRLRKARHPEDIAALERWLHDVNPRIRTPLSNWTFPCLTLSQHSLGFHAPCHLRMSCD